MSPELQEDLFQGPFAAGSLQKATQYFRLRYLAWTALPAQFPSMPKNILKNVKSTLMCSPKACFQELWNLHTGKQAEKNESWKTQTNIYLTVNDNHHRDTAGAWCSRSVIVSSKFWTLCINHTFTSQWSNKRKDYMELFVTHCKVTGLKRASVILQEIKKALGFPSLLQHRCPMLQRTFLLQHTSRHNMMRSANSFDIKVLFQHSQISCMKFLAYMWNFM